MLKSLLCLYSRPGLQPCGVKKKWSADLADPSIKKDQVYKLDEETGLPTTTLVSWLGQVMSCLRTSGVEGPYPCWRAGDSIEVQGASVSCQVSSHVGPWQRDDLGEPCPEQR